MVRMGDTGPNGNNVQTTPIIISERVRFFFIYFLWSEEKSPGRQIVVENETQTHNRRSTKSEQKLCLSE